VSSRAPDGTRLSALVVNYNSGHYAERCVASLIRQWERAGRARADLELVLIDNASPADQSEDLARIEDLGVRVIRSETNDGYAGGMNRCFAETSGGPKDVVAILNPDLYFLEGAAETMMAYVLEHEDVGCVDPRACIDPLSVLNLPRNPLPTLMEQLRLGLARMSPACCRSYSKRRLKEAIPWWTAEEPLDATMLSGCCLFLRREVAEALPSLMDERYPLYYEDTDLFRTLAAHGLRCVHLNSARVLHHWSRSVGLGESYQGEPHRRHMLAQDAYFRKYYGRLGAAFVRWVNRIQERYPGEKLDRPLYPLEHLGSFDGPVELQLPREGRWIIELAVAPTFLLACGILHEGKDWTCPQPTWEWFFEGIYCMRAIDRDTGEHLAGWTFQKTTPGRVAPLELGEEEGLLAAHGGRA